MKKFEEMTDDEILDIKKYLILMQADCDGVPFSEFTRAGEIVTDTQVRAFIEESTPVKFIWTAEGDGGCYTDKSDRVFDTQEECYADMVQHAIQKMVWNVEWDDVNEGGSVCEDGVYRASSFYDHRTCYYPHKIEHDSYSGHYVWTIQSVRE